MEVLFAGVVLIEALTQYGKTIYEMFETGEKKKGIIQLITILLGLLIAFAFSFNIFALIGMAVNPIIGTAITGILMSRGSNWAFDFFKRFREPIPVG